MVFKHYHALVKRDRLSNFSFKDLSPIRGNGPHIKDLPELLRPRFSQFHVPDEIEGAILASRRPPLFRRSTLRLPHCFHHGLPGALNHHRIGGGQVSPRHLQANERLLMGFVPGGEQPSGFFGVAGAQADLLPGGDVFDEKASALSSEQSELGHGLSPVLIATEARKIPEQVGRPQVQVRLSKRLVHLPRPPLLEISLEITGFRPPANLTLQR